MAAPAKALEAVAVAGTVGKKTAIIDQARTATKTSALGKLGRRGGRLQLVQRW